MVWHRHWQCLKVSTGAFSDDPVVFVLGSIPTWFCSKTFAPSLMADLQDDRSLACSSQLVIDIWHLFTYLLSVLFYAGLCGSLQQREFATVFCPLSCGPPCNQTREVDFWWSWQIGVIYEKNWIGPEQARLFACHTYNLKYISQPLLAKLFTC